jgi:hypothetical protein
MARSQEGSFTWPGRARAAEVERAAALAAERGLERLRERQRERRRRAATAPPPNPPAPAEPEPAAEADPGEPEAPDPWSAEFDRLAEELIDDLRRDLGPDGRQS